MPTSPSPSDMFLVHSVCLSLTLTRSTGWTDIYFYYTTTHIVVNHWDVIDGSADLTVFRSVALKIVGQKAFIE